MELENRQRLEKNKITFILGMIILGYSTLIALLAMADKNVNMTLAVPREIVCVIALIVFLICYVRLRNKPAFVMACFACMIVVYAVTVLTQRNLYMYALVYPIMGMTVLYLNRKLSNLIMIIMVLLNIIAGIKNYIAYPQTQTQSIMQILYAILYCVAIGIVVGVLEKHTKETMDEVIHHMDTSAMMAREIVSNSEILVHTLEEAKEKSSLLTESMSTTNTSMCEIAGSVKHTAEAIEKQTLQTNDIQHNIENAGRETDEMKNSALDSQAAVKAGVELILSLRNKSL